MEMFTRNEAVSYVSDALKISSPLEKVSRDPLLFLTEYMQAFQLKSPFQSISLLSVDPTLRHRYVQRKKIIYTT